MLGAFAVLRDGAPLPLPPSRKTRALLAYLAIDGRKHQRERLCELFWELPDDPRGALRWSLSRIRQVLGDDEDVLKADRNTVQLCLDNAGFGYASIRGLTQLDLNACPLTVLESCAAQFSGPFLADLSLPRCPEFEAWRAAISDEADVLHIRLLRALIERTAEEPERALAYAHQLRRLSPGNQNLAKEIEILARAARQSAMTPQPAARTLRVAGGTTGRVGPHARSRRRHERQQGAAAASSGPSPADVTSAASLRASPCRPARPVGLTAADDRNDLGSIHRQILQHRIRQDEQLAPRAPLGEPAPDARHHRHIWPKLIIASRH